MCTRLVRLDQATSSCSHGSSHQISQPCIAALQDSGVEPLARTPFLLNYKTKSNSHSVVLEDTSKSTVDIEPSPIVLGEQTSMEKTRLRLQRIATTLADLNAEGPNAQTVNDLLTMYVGAASQHVLRMSLVPEEEAENFWTHKSRPFGHTSSNATSPRRCSFYPSNLGDLVWSCRPAACCCTMACFAIGHSHTDGDNPVTRHTPFSTRHHDFEPNLFNYKPHSHYR